MRNSHITEYCIHVLLQVWSSEVAQVEGLVGMVQGVLPNLTLVIYTLDLTTSELQQVRTLIYMI